MWGGPKFLIKISITMATITIGGTYLMTHGNDKFMNYWYSDYEKPKDTIAAMRYGQRDDIKGEYDEHETAHQNSYIFSRLCVQAVRIEVFSVT